MSRLKQAFKSIKTVEPPMKLEAAVLRSIKKAQKKQLKQQLFWAYIGLASSTLAAFYTFFVFGQIILKSEFWSIMRLALTDSGIVLANWHSFLYSVLETFPVLALAAVLLPVFVLFISISSYLNLNYKNNFNHTRHRAYV